MKAGISPIERRENSVRRSSSSRSLNATMRMRVCDLEGHLDVRQDTRFTD